MALDSLSLSTQVSLQDDAGRAHRGLGRLLHPTGHLSARGRCTTSGVRVMFTVRTAGESVVQLLSRLLRHPALHRPRGPLLAAPREGGAPQQRLQQLQRGRRRSGPTLRKEEIQARLSREVKCEE